MKLAEVRAVSESTLVVHLQGDTAPPPAGCFYLARCEAGGSLTRPWETLLRRPLFPTAVLADGDGLVITFALPPSPDTGYAWLRNRCAGEQIDLLGPISNGFDLAPQSHTLLLAASLASAPLLLPLIDPVLDRGGRVSVLLRVPLEEQPAARDLLAQLPYAVEARAESADRFIRALGELITWADQCAFSFPFGDYAQISAHVRSRRMRPLPRFAQALVLTDLPCGSGACLACIVPLLRGGHTRACVHGPVFDLLEIA